MQTSASSQTDDLGLAEIGVGVNGRLERPSDPSADWQTVGERAAALGWERPSVPSDPRPSAKMLAGRLARRARPLLLAIPRRSCSAASKLPDDLKALLASDPAAVKAVIAALPRESRREVGLSWAVSELEDASQDGARIQKWIWVTIKLVAYK